MRSLILLAAIAAVAIAGILMFSGPDPNAVPQTGEVAGRMMSPFCPGLTLDECPSGQSSRVRGEIEEMVARGATNAEIDRWIVDNYGEVALARPGSPAAWLAPPLLGIAGAGALLVVLRRKVRPAPLPAPVQLDQDDEQRFEQDFSSFQRGSE